MITGGFEQLRFDNDNKDVNHFAPKVLLRIRNNFLCRYNA